MGAISFGGLATGLDTNSIIDQLTGLERNRRVGFLEVKQLEAQAQQSALQSFNSKLVSVLSAVDALRNSDSSLARTANSSDTSVLTATAGSGALPGATEITVNTLARGAVATSGAGVASSSSTVASSSGTFEFQVGSGATQSISIDASTTLEGLAASINALGGGATASVVNLGTEASPDYRLRLASDQTGTENAVSITNDDTDISVAVTQAALNASFSVSGFATAVTRSSNVVTDVIPGVTLNLVSTGGPTTVAVATDDTAVADKVESVVSAYNDLINFVNTNSQVSQDETSDEGNIAAGPLAFDGTVRSILDGLRSNLTGVVEGLSGDYVLLADMGVTSNQDGTISFDSSKLTSALAANEGDVSELFAGDGTNDGVFDRVHGYLTEVTQSGGLLAIRTNGIADEISSLEDRIAAGERSVAAFEDNLRAQFTSLEVLVSSLQSQGSFLVNALGGTPQT